MNIRQVGKDARGRYVWILDYRPLGTKGPRKRTRIITESTVLRYARKEIERIAADLEAELVNRRAGLARPPRQVDVAVEAYLSAMAADARESYLVNLRRTLRLLAKRYRGRSCAEISRAELKADLVARAGQVSARTANRELAEVRAFLAWEVDGDFLEANPALGIRNLKHDAKRVEIFRPAEYSKVWHEISKPPRTRPVRRGQGRGGRRPRGDRAPLLDALDLLLACGWRWGELRRMRLEAIQENLITLEERKARDNLPQPAGPRFLELLQPRLRSLPWPYLSRITKHLKLFCEDVDVRPRGVHALRHSCATWLLAAGVGIYNVKEWLGHSSVAVTEGYVKLGRGFNWKQERKALPRRTRDLFEEAIVCASTLRPPPNQIRA